MSQTNPSHSRTSSVASVLLFTRGFFKTQLWVWPLVAALVLGIIGVWLRVKMEGATKQQIADMLQTILNANTEALNSWSGAMKADAENLADDDRVGEFVTGLIQQAKSNAQVQAALLTAPQLSVLRAYLKPMIERRGFSGFVVLDTNFLVLASGHDSLLGTVRRLSDRQNFGHAAIPQRGTVAGWTRPSARWCADHVCRRAHSVAGRKNHCHARIAHRAGHGLHSHSRHGPRRQDR
jgi:hypothetical protein